MADDMVAKRCIAVIGGTGDLGFGLALRLAMAGHEVIVGSRTAAKALDARERLVGLCAERGKSDVSVSGTDNPTAAATADLSVLAVPHGVQQATLDDIAPGLQGKILVLATVPLVPPRVARVQLPPQGAAAVEAQCQLSDSVQVVSALQNVAAAHLLAEGPVPCDVLVTGNSVDARETVIGLLRDAGLSGIHAGPIENSAAAEAMTSLLISINKRYKCHSGIRVTGIPGRDIP